MSPPPFVRPAPRPTYRAERDSGSVPTATSSTSNRGRFAHYLRDPYTAPPRPRAALDDVTWSSSRRLGGLLVGARLR